MIMLEINSNVVNLSKTVNQSEVTSDQQLRWSALQQHNRNSLIINVYHLNHSDHLIIFNKLNYNPSNVVFIGILREGTFLKGGVHISLNHWFRVDFPVFIPVLLLK